jgi:L-rhamnonate dehydratase
MKRFEQYRLFWLEEPLEPYDFGGYAGLAASGITPIAAGELAASAAELTRLLEEKSVNVLQVDVSRVGLTQAMKVAALAASQLQLWDQSGGIPSLCPCNRTDIPIRGSIHA